MSIYSYVLLVTWVFQGSHIPYRTGLARAPRCPPSRQNQVHHIVHTLPFPDGRENRGSISTHELGIPVHDGERCTNVRCQVDLRRSIRT